MPVNLIPIRKIELGDIIDTVPLDQLDRLYRTAEKRGYRMSQLGRTNVNIARNGRERIVPALFLTNSLEETKAVIYPDSLEDKSLAYRLRECSYI